VLLYPFFLDGIAEEAGFNLSDGIHPNRAGVAKIVEGILPAVEAVLDRLGQAGAPSGAAGNR